MTDSELMKKVKNQPDKGIEEAIQLYGPLVKGIIIKIVGGDKGIDVQECITQVFVRLWKYQDKYNAEKGTLKNYLITIARNEALRMKKQLYEQRQEEVLEEYDLGIDVDMTHEVASKMNKRIIYETIDSLKDPDRQIFIRKYFWGQRIKDIANELRLKEKFVENRLYLVKKKMRQKLIERGIVL